MLYFGEETGTTFLKLSRRGSRSSDCAFSWPRETVAKTQNVHSRFVSVFDLFSTLASYPLFAKKTYVRHLVTRARFCPLAPRRGFTPFGFFVVARLPARFIIQFRERPSELRPELHDRNRFIHWVLFTSRPAHEPFWSLLSLFFFRLRFPHITHCNTILSL